MTDEVFRYMSCAAPIALAGVYERLGSEMPPEMGFAPDETVAILLPPEVLEAAAKAVRYPLPIILAHEFGTFVGAADGFVYRPDNLKLGARITIWDQDLVAGLRDGTAPRELSIGFGGVRYEATPGEVDGVPYGLVVKTLTLTEVSILPEGMFGEACALPPCEPS